MPDETTILNFRRLLAEHQLTAAFMNTINDIIPAAMKRTPMESNHLYCGGPKGFSRWINSGRGNSLEQEGLLLKVGNMTDATLIRAVTCH